MNVQTGAKYRLREIVFVGGKNMSESELNRLVRLKPGSVFDTEAVGRTLENIRKAYIEKGLTTATPVPTAKVDEKTAMISLTIDMHEGGLAQ